MALRRDYIKVTIPANATEAYIGKIEPKYHPVEAVLLNYYFYTQGRAEIRVDWQGAKWSFYDSKNLPDANHPFQCNWKIKKPECVTVYANDKSGASNEIIVYYELDEEPVVKPA
jgi:hypothetical protein